MLINPLRTLSIRFPVGVRFLSSTTEASSKPELFEREVYLENRVARLVLNAPKIRNSLSYTLMDSLLNELKEVDKIQKLRAVIIAGKGPAFSAGHDLKELTTETGADYHKKLFSKCSELMTFIQQMQLPVIAEVDGVAAAAGCQLVSSCDVVVASPKSTFMVPGQRVGLFCSTPAIPLVRNISRKVAMDMLLTARAITAQEALQAGLVSRMSKEDEEPRFEALKVAEQICQFSKSVTALGKIFFYTQVELPQRDAYRFGEAVMVENLKLKDTQEGIDAFIKKRHPEFKHNDEKVH